MEADWPHTTASLQQQLQHSNRAPEGRREEEDQRPPGDAQLRMRETRQASNPGKRCGIQQLTEKDGEALCLI